MKDTKRARSIEASSALRRKIRGLERELAQEKDRGGELSARLNIATELEIKIKNGQFGMRERSEFARALGMAAGELFLQEGATNYLELHLNPSGPNVPDDFGPLLVTFQRVNGLTPGQVVADALRLFNRRFVPTRWDDIKEDGLYLFCLSRKATTDSAFRWHFAKGLRKLSNVGNHPITALLSQRYGRLEAAPLPDPMLAELYELRDPFRPRPEYVPTEGAQFVTVEDVAFPETGMARLTGKETGPVGVIELRRGTVCAVNRRPGHGGFRWYITPEDSKAAVGSFRDDGGEVPEYLGPLDSSRPVSPGVVGPGYRQRNV